MWKYWWSVAMLTDSAYIGVLITVTGGTQHLRSTVKSAHMYSSADKDGHWYIGGRAGKDVAKDGENEVTMTQWGKIWDEESADPFSVTTLPGPRWGFYWTLRGYSSVMKLSGSRWSCDRRRIWCIYCLPEDCSHVTTVAVWYIAPRLGFWK